MVIVLVKWKIKPDCIDAFLEHWRQKTVVQDRKGLMGEFLSEVGSEDWINWDLDKEVGTSEPSRLFVNVGLWEDSHAFHSQIGQYFKGKDKQEEFEVSPRVRTVLEPKCWRMGDASLPLHDSGGVL